jgi:hypothetical protein
MRRFVVILACLAVIAVASAIGLQTLAQAAELPKPEAPLALASGESVNLAWSLPPKPKPELVVIFRSTADISTMVEVGRAPASDLRFTDSKVTLGVTYQYRIKLLKGAKESPLSEAVEVLVGGNARITFLGGSLDRALFEVTMFRRGQRISSQFVQKIGDQVGDLAYVAGLDYVEDFRLGPKLTALVIGVAESQETIGQPLLGPDGQPQKNLGGRDVQIEFKFPGATHEIMIATLTDKAGKTIQIKEGESYTVE